MTPTMTHTKAKVAWIAVSTIMLIAAVWFDLYQATVQQRILSQLQASAIRTDSVRELLFRKVARIDSLASITDSLIIRELKK